jgi:hypothetical protein
MRFGEVSTMTTPFRGSLRLCGGSGECSIRPEDPAHVATGSSLAQLPNPFLQRIAPRRQSAAGIELRHQDALRVAAARVQRHALGDGRIPI